MGLDIRTEGGWVTQQGTGDRGWAWGQRGSFVEQRDHGVKEGA